MKLSIYLEAKFYEMILSENKIIIHYGKINGKEREVIKIFKNIDIATNFFLKKTKKQLIKKSN